MRSAFPFANGGRCVRLITNVGIVSASTEGDGMVTKVRPVFVVALPAVLLKPWRLPPRLSYRGFLKKEGTQTARAGVTV